MSVKILYLITLLDALGMGLTIPLINGHVLALGGSLFSSGILMSLSSGAQLFGSPVIGSWSDTRGRKLLLLSTLSLVFISNALSGVSSLRFFFLGRILYGLAHQTDPLIKALIADSVLQEQQAGIFSKLMAVTISAFIIAPIMGGILYESFKSFSYISLILCSLDVVTISISYLYVQESIKPKAENKEKEEMQKLTFMQSIYADLSKIFTDLKKVEWSRYGDLLAIKFILESAFHMLVMNMGVILMTKFLYTKTQMGLAISYLSLCMIASTLLAGFIIKSLYKADQSGFQRLLHGFILMLTLFCVLPFTNTAMFYLSIFLPFCIIKGTLDTTWMEILTSRTTEKDKGVMMGAATSMLWRETCFLSERTLSLAGLVSPLVNGFTGDFIGIQALLMLPLIPAITGIVFVNKVKSTVSTEVEKRD